MRRGWAKAHENFVEFNLNRLLKGKRLDLDTETMVTRFVGGMRPGKR